MKKTISREQIVSNLKDRVPMTLIEALPPRYYDAEHLPGALNLPHDQVQMRAPELLPDRDALIVAYCSNSNCGNSSIAARTLEQMGYRNVFVYAGGKQDWIDAGQPTETRAPRAVA